jgi:hypothetical protein
MDNPILPSTIGKSGIVKIPPDGKKRRFIVNDEVRLFQNDNRNKIIILQRIQFDNGREEVRLGYYIIGKKPGMKGRWTWGQYATMMPLRDFQELISQAKEKGWW